ncbi:AAA family ATPase [Vulcanisaeta thermophila]|uniref:AAA family ATPase n=1 Tax=Vulcanisaeta thermophila TaxID=867917 RepID=UPI000ABAA9A6|nr:AAA family ATPase [Vulcanisaeta thermophila]
MVYSNRIVALMSRLFTAVIYLIIATIAFIVDFPFYPLPIALLIIAVTTALAYAGHTKLGFGIMIVLLIPALLYAFKYAALGTLLLILMLILLIAEFDWLGVGVGIIGWELVIMPNAWHVLGVPVILTSPSLTVGVARRVTPLKSLITFIVLYIPTLLLLNAASLVPWFGSTRSIMGGLTALPVLTTNTVVSALHDVELGLNGLGHSIYTVFNWTSTYVLPPLMALVAYVAYLVSNRLRKSGVFALRYFAPTVATVVSYAMLTYLLFYLNPYFSLYQGVDVNTLMRGLVPALILSLTVLPPIMHYRLIETRFEEEEKAVERALQVGFQLIINRDELRKMAEEWDDVVGIDDVKNDIEQSVIAPLKDPRTAQRYGLALIHGVLLFGPPGVGKTMLARAIAGKLGWNTLIVNIGELLSKYYGESENRLTELFKTARRYAPAVLIIDEVDAIGKARTKYVSDDVTPRLLNILLGEMDGINKRSENILVIATTNQPDLLDPALLRPGRFDKVIYVPPPNEEARARLFRKLLSGKPISGNIDYEKLARMTDRFSGADIMNVVRTAVLEAARSNKPITQEDLEKIISKYKPSLTYDLLEKYEAFRLQYSRYKVQERPMFGIPEVTWDDVGDLEDVKELINKYVVTSIKKREILEKLGIEPIRGILLFGPPGVGKTLIAKATANMLKASFIELNGAELARVGPERAAAIVKDIFSRARENAPAIVFIDEVDSIAPRRDSPTGFIWSMVVSQLLTEMDGLRESTGVIVMGATNRPWALDPALLRPGRFDKVIYIPPPNRDARRKILMVHLRNTQYDQGVLDWLADRTEGFSGADLAALVREAKMRALDRVLAGSSEVMLTKEDFEEALRRVKPSITRDVISQYEDFINKINNIT